MFSPFEPTRLTFFEYLNSFTAPELLFSTYTNEFIFNLGSFVFASIHSVLLYMRQYSPLFAFDLESNLEYVIEYLMRSHYIPLYIVNIQWFSLFVFFGYVAHFCISQVTSVHHNLNMYLLSELYKVIYNLVVSYIHPKDMYLFPFFFFLFNFILFYNLLGLFPFSFALTSHLSITFCLAFICWLGTLAKGIKLHGLGYFKTFVLTGIPSVLVLMLIIIELLSYTVRIFSLSLRLFANIVAGHILLHVLVNIINVIDFNFITGASIFSTASSVLVFSVLAVLILFETAVACLQAYIFLVLTVIYVRDVLYMAH